MKTNITDEQLSDPAFAKPMAGEPALQRASQPTKHTPGHWICKRRYPNAWKVYTDGENQICELDHWTEKQKDLSAALRPDDEVEANARLIASAPELLEALEYALGDFNAIEQPMRAWVIKARAAIAKATGETP